MTHFKNGFFILFLFPLVMGCSEDVPVSGNFSVPLVESVDFDTEDEASSQSEESSDESQGLKPNPNLQQQMDCVCENQACGILDCGTDCGACAEGMVCKNDFCITEEEAQQTGETEVSDSTQPIDQMDADASGSNEESDSEGEPSLSDITEDDAAQTEDIIEGDGVQTQDITEDDAAQTQDAVEDAMPENEEDTENPCSPTCEGKQCGDDGCGGICGICISGANCSVSGQCIIECEPDCTGKECGDDGCGGVCGVCALAESCNEGVCECVPDCNGKECGYDGCGGLCGICEVSYLCENGGCIPPANEQNCCEAGVLPGCGTSDCESCVCDSIEYCCVLVWDQTCATFASFSCGDICNCPASCGDGQCGEEETCQNCQEDCGSCGFCGDGQCSEEETCQNCQEDCGSCGFCGDGACSPDETCSSCPQDCGPCPEVDDTCCVLKVDEFTDTAALPASAYQGCVENLPCESCVCGLDSWCCTNGWDLYCEQAANGPCVAECGCGEPTSDFQCGNGICEEPMEACGWCPQDCGACQFCGNDVCDDDETCDLCPSDCGSCLGEHCGDSICNANETCENCAVDCCADGNCGDGICGAGEDCNTCSQDCGACPDICGDGTCGTGEDCITCSQDCGPCPAPCGDGICDVGESCNTCAVDCCPGTGQSCCEPTATGAPGCGDSVCQDCVCSLEPYCCDVAYSPVCALLASDPLYCGGGFACTCGGTGNGTGTCTGNCSNPFYGPDGVEILCWCDSFCVSAGDCCTDACSECGYCDGGLMIP